MTYIKGNLKQIIYKSDSGFIVGLFKVIDTDDITEYLNKSITFTGNFHDLKMETSYILHGNLVEHPKYGEQFSVTSFEVIMPESTNGIISFLSSKLFPGVGVKLATKIVNTLGDDALDKIYNDYHNLLIVPNITEKKAMKIQSILKREKESYKTIVNLQNMGFSINEASWIYKYYKESTMVIIDDNIYTLVNDIEGIGFLTIDKIASTRGILENDKRRIKACVLYIMNELCMTNGNIYNVENDIYLGVSNYLRFDFASNDFNYYILELNKENKIIIENNHYYLKSYYDAEIYIANFINSLLKVETDNNLNLDKQIIKLEKEYKLKYNDKQRLAIRQSVEKNFLVITGGPGTGKTTIIKAIVNLYINLNNLTLGNTNDEIALLAPTGRAAKRMMETTGMSAMTIHKFLKWNKETNEFGVNESNKANVKFVIVDEVSMIDHFLLANLFKGLPKTTKLVFVGDHYQLPSVGPGEVLKDLINSNCIPTVILNDLYRQQDNSYIISLAHEIKQGIVPSKLEERQDDYNFIEAKHTDIKTYIVKLCENALNKGYSPSNIQVLIPMYKGINGIDMINVILQDIFNPLHDKKNEFTHGNVAYRIGDKVLQIKNNNDLNISNGDIGIIENIVHLDGECTILIDFDGEIIEYKPKDFEDIRLGYAISIHKAQGSEFDIVILPMDMAYNRMLYRKLIYTAVTRVKKVLMLVGEKEAFKKAILNDKEQHRKTSLCGRLISSSSKK